MILGELTAPVLVLDASLRAIMANSSLCRALHIPCEDIEGRSLPDLFTEATVPGVLDSLLSGVLQPAHNLDPVELVCILNDGERATLSVSARRVVDDENVMVLVEIRDVTLEQEFHRRAREMNGLLLQSAIDLEGTNRELEAFTHSASHDLRTPLRFTNKIAHLLLQEPAISSVPSAVGKVQMILDSTAEMGRLIEDLLIFSHANRQPIKKRRIAFDRLVAEALRDLEDEYAGT